MEWRESYVRTFLERDLRALGSFMVRRLPPYWANVGKRLVKAPKLYLRDSGLLHTLLGLADREALRSLPP